jgi:hypothetical protein
MRIRSAHYVCGNPAPLSRLFRSHGRVNRGGSADLPGVDSVLSPFFFISEKSGLQKRLTNLCNAPPFRSGDYLQALLKLGPNLQILAVLPNVLMSHNVGILSSWKMLGAPPPPFNEAKR